MSKNSSVETRFGWLASYPKSGNTWMRMMLYSLRREKLDINSVHDASILTRNDFEQYFGFKSSVLTQEEIDAVRPDLHRALASAWMEPLLLRKVHDCYWKNAAGEAVFPADVSRGVVYIARDPRDVAVSYSHHNVSDVAKTVHNLCESGFTIAKSIKAMKFQFSQPLGSWSEHVTSWLDQTEIPVLLVRYEDMLEDSCRELVRVAEFLGLPQASNAEACAQAALASSFENLRAQEEEKGFREKPTKAKRFFRSGRAGEGLEVLSPDLLDRIESANGAVMQRLGYQLSV
jgi:aryl sulfotransferase